MNEMNYIFTGLFNREHGAFKSSDAEMKIYGLIAGEMYTIEGSHGMKYVKISMGNWLQRYSISQQLVDIYFKPLQEVRDIKIEQLLA